MWSCVLNDPALLAATASADFSARVWNAVTGDELHRFDHKHVVRGVAFSHGEASAHMVSGGMRAGSRGGGGLGGGGGGALRVGVHAWGWDLLRASWAAKRARMN